MGHKLNFPDDDTEVFSEKTFSSQFVGVVYRENGSKWQAQRRSKHGKKMFFNGSYNNEKTAAHASDTLARKLMANGDQGRKLNFPDDDTEVFPEEMKSSQFVGVFRRRDRSKWQAMRRSKHEEKNVYNGSYKDEETAAHASDTLARELITNGEKGHKLNFPDDITKVCKNKKASIYIGVSYQKRNGKWNAQRGSKYENKTIQNGSYKDEKTASHASDTLARKLIANGEKGHKLNFPEDLTEVHPEIQN